MMDDPFDFAQDRFTQVLWITGTGRRETTTYCVSIFEDMRVLHFLEGWVRMGAAYRQVGLFFGLLVGGLYYAVYEGCGSGCFDGFLL